MDFNSFDINLFKTLCESSEENKNVVISPMSISFALSMLLIGSDEATKKEIENVLGFAKDEKLFDKLNSLNNTINTSTEGLDLTVESFFYSDEHFEIRNDYLANLKKALNCQVKSLDNKKKRAKAKGIMTFETTFEQKKTCTITSYISFRAVWLDQFKPLNTYCCNFLGEDKNVKMMYQNNVYSFHSEHKFKCVKIPYLTTDLSMLIILPEKGFSINEVLKILDVNKFQSLKNENNFSQTSLCLNLPVFEIGYKQSLKNVFVLLGINKAFGENEANFSAISNDAVLRDCKNFVSKDVHEILIETCEEGTETGASKDIKSMATKPAKVIPIGKPFVVDHPFLFVVQYKKQTLFMGKVSSL